MLFKNLIQPLSSPTPVKLNDVFFMCKIHDRTSMNINSFLKHRILYKTNIYNNLKLKKMKKCLLVIVITGIMTSRSLEKFYSSKTAAIKPNITCKKSPECLYIPGICLIFFPPLFLLLLIKLMRTNHQFGFQQFVQFRLRQQTLLQHQIIYTAVFFQRPFGNAGRVFIT